RDDRTGNACGQHPAAALPPSASDIPALADRCCADGAARLLLALFNQLSAPFSRTVKPGEQAPLLSLDGALFVIPWAMLLSRQQYGLPDRTGDLPQSLSILRELEPPGFFVLFASGEANFSSRCVFLVEATEVHHLHVHAIGVAQCFVVSVPKHTPELVQQF